MSRNCRSYVAIALRVLILLALLFLAIRMLHAQEAEAHFRQVGNLCSPNILNGVGQGFSAIGTYLGEDARILVQSFVPKEEHTWTITFVKVVATRDGYVFMYVIENDCVRTIIGRSAEEYRKVKK